jgi:hypothetical protein
MNNARSPRRRSEPTPSIGAWATPWLPLLALLLRAFDGVIRTGDQFLPTHDVLAAATWQIAQSMR